ncbi:histidinol-phosphate transaminase [Robertkochia flava]|uniref:histidinol-phosphate transaminase n=1 Tax=Robertkochia flava TaxID=3447986 RepID=UPI001CCE1031|nr:histidinol-phosphate transaminase [Robertkochia marina]
MSTAPVKTTFELEKMVRPSVLKLQPYSSARDEFSTGSEEMIFLDANENPFGTPINRYPDPYQKKLKEALATVRGVDPEQILIGNGSDEVLDLLFRVFCEPGEANVITLPPTYGMYEVLAGINNVEVRSVALDENFQPRVDDILNIADENTRILFLCSPNNPTGNLMNASRVKRLLEQFRGLVVIDEAYIDFAQVKSWAKELDVFPNLVIVQTLSKAFALAGARVGYAITSPGIIGFLNKIKPPYNVNQLSQDHALEVLNNPASARALLKSLVVERSYLTQQLEVLPFVKKVFPSEANFLLIRVDDAGKRYTQLLEKGIVVRNRSSLPGCNQTLRITVGTPEENRQLVTILNQLPE